MGALDALSGLLFLVVDALDIQSILVLTAAITGSFCHEYKGHTKAKKAKGVKLLNIALSSLLSLLITYAIGPFVVAHAFTELKVVVALVFGFVGYSITKSFTSMNATLDTVERILDIMIKAWKGFISRE